MEFITVDKFKAQPEEVQKVFLDWWYWSKEHISDYDLIQDGNQIMLYKDYLKREDIENDSYPLFTEGQLREFIEYKTCGILDLECCSFNDDYYCYEITIFEVKEDEDVKGFGRILFDKYIECEDLLQAYWRVACMIVKEKLNE